ncbi:hypothetical protein PPL_00796 [Heterostelium album PN500]|uniref:Uncharacterized protein n=1 Tax=Heterostelium pallidum (strain ATCC 26659 / Pp 5 / PN500) TaxID=670386 RepID=D3AXG5_HETP5|nr:hypothetical protein PPL_00796 [Heterostelium album PN500]EFA86234.1 hypothetical protein PPL_00796 [Heterostelium album PN500]|eukprot:XP_020438339.1 hypothetical protein PPL_00796 [Heterostelium album PN500]
MKNLNPLKFVSIATNNPLKIRLKPVYEEDKSNIVINPSPMAIKEYRRRNTFGKAFKYT